MKLGSISISAVALGGKTEPANLRVLCRQHNLLHARQTFGHEFVQEKIRAGGRK